MFINGTGLRVGGWAEEEEEEERLFGGLGDGSKCKKSAVGVIFRRSKDRRQVKEDQRVLS